MMPASQRIIALATIAWAGTAQAHSGHGLDGLLAHASVHGTEIAALGLSLAITLALGRKARQRCAQSAAGRARSHSSIKR